MKKTAFIVCEYNPFHNGHAHHIVQTRAAGAETVICVMSGNFVQRGAMAFADKALRTSWAIRNGADLVLELPLPYVLSGAGSFADGAAKVIGALGTAGTLSFGSGGSIEDLRKLYRAISSADVPDRVRALCESNHVTYPRALQAVASDLLPPQTVSLLRDPNAVLALEYLRAASAYAPDVDFYCVHREPACGHDADSAVGEFASAKYIRNLFSSDPDNAPEIARRYVPDCVYRSMKIAIESGLLPLQADAFSRIAVSRLVTLDAGTLKNTNGVRQGIENRFLEVLKTANDLQTLYDAVKTKRFTHARIRQIAVSAALGIERGDLDLPLPYLRVLGMNENGKRFLREHKDTFRCPAIMNLSEAPASRMRELDAFAGRLTELCRPSPRSSNGDYAVKPYVEP